MRLSQIVAGNVVLLPSKGRTKVLHSYALGMQTTYLKVSQVDSLLLIVFGVNKYYILHLYLLSADSALNNRGLQLLNTVLQFQSS